MLVMTGALLPAFKVLNRQRKMGMLWHTRGCNITFWEFVFIQRIIFTRLEAITPFALR